MTKRKDPLDLTRLSYDRWHEVYQPRKNHLDPSKAATVGEVGQCEMFETYGPELEFVQAQPDEFVWTVLDCDGKLYIGDGYHWVNRLGYFVTKVARKPGAQLYILY